MNSDKLCKIYEMLRNTGGKTISTSLTRELLFVVGLFFPEL